MTSSAELSPSVQNIIQKSQLKYIILYSVQYKVQAYENQ